MLYKHWKKVLLSLTALFWASCDTTSSADDDGSTPYIDNPDPRSSSATEGADTSSASETPESSAEAASSTEETPSSSSSEAAPASSDTPNVTSSDARVSSSETIVAPKYGVPISSSSETIVAPKYGVMFTCERKGKKIACDDGVTCTEEETETAQTPQCSGDQICAKYGVVYVKETTYKCDDGRVYNYAEFQSKYNILDGAVDLYGCPSDICGPDTTIDEPKPLYGI
ncbi:MAG: hypothetical protein IJ734_05535 [Fibrobacter sp.]|nr:hypothetical protein [Fibrobacter sp.]